MRTALLIGLIAASVAGGALAQTSPFRNPYGMGPAKDPYDLPKAYQTNPYDRDYSKPAAKSPGYRNADGSLPSQRSSSSSAGGFYSGYGARSSAPPSYGSAARRDPACSRPGVVC